MTSPYYHKLIPDPDGSMQKTLVINLNKTLISYSYQMGKGFEIIKRPGLNKFLLEMSNYYEIVVFGDEDSNVSLFRNYYIVKYIYIYYLYLIIINHINLQKYNNKSL